MIKNKTLISLRDYIDKAKDKKLAIPNYQRGYVWGKSSSHNNNNDRDSVTYMTDSIINAFNNKYDLFLQGITVSENETAIKIIDGQQRTTYLYLLLAYLGVLEDSKFSLSYDIREDSKEFLASLVDNSECTYLDPSKDEPNQDIFYFKKTLHILNTKLDGFNHSELYEFILDKIQFLYIKIPSNQSETAIFSMMNGHKAIMRQEEIIKAQILRQVSQNTSDDKTIAWETSMLRSRYAREWDKWLHWWNKSEVKKWINPNTELGVMGLLISSKYREKYNEVLSFEGFKERFLKGNSVKEAKDIFDSLRRLQKRFEDAYDNPKIYNYIGAIIRLLGAEDRFKFIRDYFIEAKNIDIKWVYRCVFLELSYDEIIKKEGVAEKVEEMIATISDSDLYRNNSNAAFKLLLRLNLDEDCKQNINKDTGEVRGRKFDFSIWDRGSRDGNKSLEHIYPKSRVWHKDEEGQIFTGADTPISAEEINFSGYISRDDIYFEFKDEDNKLEKYKASEHSIGNLVLLYKDNNSSFSDKLPEEKKNMFFDPKVKNIFRSRHLLHTIYTFADSNWGINEKIAETIAKNKKAIIDDLKKYYNAQ